VAFSRMALGIAASVRASEPGATHLREGVVLGRVALAGKVIEHELGYRGQRVRVVELIPNGVDDAVTPSIAALLGVRVADPYLNPTLDRLVEHVVAKHRVRDAAERAAMSERARSLTRAERVRLVTHWRHFRVIRGDAPESS
jgi:hypothetical protein